MTDPWISLQQDLISDQIFIPRIPAELREGLVKVDGRTETFSTSTFLRISVQTCMLVCTLLPFRSPIPEGINLPAGAVGCGCFRSAFLLAQCGCFRSAFTLAVVAATPVVANVVRRSIGFMVNMEFESELSVCVLEHLKEVGSQPTALRRQWLACASVSAARKATRTRTVSQCQMVGIEEALEVVDVPSADLDLHLRMEALDVALKSEVISVVEAHVIKMTRVEGVELAELARALNLPDATLQKRRRRAEVRLREAIADIETSLRQD